MNNSSPISRCVRICQHRSCRKQAAAKVLAAFQKHSIPGVEIQTCQCFGHCGQGPMVLILPDKVWYCRVLPEEVNAIAQRHLLNGQPIAAMQYHPKS